MIHGETRIKLYNPISGNIIKDVKSENTFQSTAIARGLRNLGECNASPLNNSTFKSGGDYWKKTLGGILLFKDSITGENTHYMNAGNKMTANAAVDYTNASTPSEMGSFSSATINTTPDKQLILDYEWTTTQGNGKIKSVCLTSQLGGIIGYGNPSLEKLPNNGNQNYYFTKNIDYQFADSKSSYTNLQGAIVNNYKYYFTNSNKIVTVKKTKVCITTGSVFDTVAETFTFDLATIGNPLNWNGDACYVTTSNKKIYILPNINQGNTSPNGNIYVYEYDTEDDTLQLLTIKNKSTRTVIVRPSNTSYYFGVAHGMIFLHDYTNQKTVVLDLETNDFITEVDINCTFYCYYSASELPNGLVMLGDCNTNGNVYDFYMFDPTNNTCYPINSSAWNVRGVLYSPYIYDADMDCLVFSASGGVSAINNPLYLATVNNMSEVEKTIELAMQVTYTLTGA